MKHVVLASLLSASKIIKGQSQHSVLYRSIDSPAGSPKIALAARVRVVTAARFIAIVPTAAVRGESGGLRVGLEDIHLITAKPLALGITIPLSGAYTRNVNIFRGFLKFK